MLAIDSVTDQHPAHRTRPEVRSGFVLLSVGGYSHWENPIPGGIGEYAVDLAALLAFAIHVSVPPPDLFAVPAEGCPADNTLYPFASVSGEGSGMTALLFGTLSGRDYHIVLT